MNLQHHISSGDSNNKNWPETGDDTDDLAKKPADSAQNEDDLPF